MYDKSSEYTTETNAPLSVYEYDGRILSKKLPESISAITAAETNAPVSVWEHDERKLNR